MHPGGGGGGGAAAAAASDEKEAFAFPLFPLLTPPFLEGSMRHGRLFTRNTFSLNLISLKTEAKYVIFIGCERLKTDELKRLP